MRMRMMSLEEFMEMVDVDIENVDKVAKEMGVLIIEDEESAVHEEMEAQY